jgi:hypothetical protein
VLFPVKKGLDKSNKNSFNFLPEPLKIDHKRLPFLAAKRDDRQQ